MYLYVFLSHTLDDLMYSLVDSQFEGDRRELPKLPHPGQVSLGGIEPSR